MKLLAICLGVILLSVLVYTHFRSPAPASHHSSNHRTTSAASSSSSQEIADAVASALKESSEAYDDVGVASRSVIATDSPRELSSDAQVVRLRSELAKAISARDQATRVAEEAHVQAQGEHEALTSQIEKLMTELKKERAKAAAPAPSKPCEAADSAALTTANLRNSELQNEVKELQKKLSEQQPSLDKCGSMLKQAQQHLRLAAKYGENMAKQLNQCAAAVKSNLQTQQPATQEPAQQSQQTSQEPQQPPQEEVTEDQSQTEPVGASDSEASPADVAETSVDPTAAASDPTATEYVIAEVATPTPPDAEPIQPQA